MKLTVRKMLLAAGVAALPLTAAAAPPPAVGVEKSLSGVQGVIESVDQSERRVLVRVPKGLVTIYAGPEVKNLRQVKAGDVVRVQLRETVIAKLAPAADPTKLPEVGEEELTAAPGQTPRSYQYQEVRANVRITGIDLDKNLVTFTGANDIERFAKLKNPAMIEFLHKLKVGDVVAITYGMSVAEWIEPMGYNPAKPAS